MKNKTKLKKVVKVVETIDQKIAREKALREKAVKIYEEANLLRKEIREYLADYLPSGQIPYIGGCTTTTGTFRPMVGSTWETLTVVG